MVQKILIFLSLLFLSSCLKEEDIKLPFESLTPMQLNDGWEVNSPDNVGVDKAALTKVFEEFHSDKEMWQPRSLIVVKDGYLVAETYTKDKNDQTTPQAVWSCTKQILAIIVMKAIEDGYIASLDETIADRLPAAASKHPDKGGITLRQLMTMTSGIRFENSGLNGDTNKLLRREPANSVDYILGLPLCMNPGEKFNYSDGDPQIISAMLASAIGTDLNSWSKSRLFEPMKIRNYDWLVYPDGVTMGAFGLKLTPRDLAKFGQLIIDDPSLRTLIEPRVPANKVNYEKQEFGLLWWVNPEDGTPYMHGQGGQYVMINFEHRMVVCITSEPNTQGDCQFSLRNAFDVYHNILNCL